MLVADACSGLHSMYSLSALGTLFMYIMGRTSRLHNAIMVASILPIAFAANIVRVMILVLITYHLGDEAGQGFLHGTAGIVLMLVALACFFALDALLARILRRREPLATHRPLRSRALSAGGACGRKPAELAPCLRWHGREQVGGELLLQREGARGVAVDRRDAKQQAIGHSGRSSPSFISTMRFCNVLVITVSLTVDPVGDRLVPIAQRRAQPAHRNVAVRRGECTGVVAEQLESLRRVADLGLVRLQAAALVVAIGQRQHDAVAL